MSACCREPDCKRKQPILLRRAPFSDRWMVITRYTQHDDGMVRATDKHELDEKTSGALSRAFAERDDVADLTDSAAKVATLLKHLGLDPGRRVASGHTFAQTIAATALGIDVYVLDESAEAVRAGETS